MTADAPALLATPDATLEADGLPEPFAGAVASAGQGSRVLLTREGKPVAFLVPVEDAEALEALEDAADARLAAEAIARWEAAGRPLGPTLEEVAARHGIDLATEAE